jgi:hypothetical protein
MLLVAALALASAGEHDLGRVTIAAGKATRAVDVGRVLKVDDARPGAGRRTEIDGERYGSRAAECT